VLLVAFESPASSPEPKKHRLATYREILKYYFRKAFRLIKILIIIAQNNIVFFKLDFIQHCFVCNIAEFIKRSYREMF